MVTPRMAENLHLECISASWVCAGSLCAHCHVRVKWTHWDLNPRPSACEADVIPLHHVPSDV